MLMLYNTALVHVLQILMSFQAESEAKRQHETTKLSAALEICRCFPYSSLRASRESSNSSSSNGNEKSRLDSGYLPMCHLAIRAAWMALGESWKGSPGRRWITDMLSVKRHGVFAEGLWADQLQELKDCVCTHETGDISPETLH